MISIQTYRPEKLSSLIKSFWYLKVSDDLDQLYVEEILPDGHHEIIFHLDSSPARKRNNKTGWEKDPAIFFAGQNRRSYVQQLRPGSIIYGVRFHPHTQALFYDFPACLSTENLISFQDMVFNDIVTSCISESPGKTFANLEKEFIKKASRLKPHERSFQYVDAVIQRMVDLKGAVKISALEKITGVSTRYLEKSFQKYVGVTPKQFCNVIRYNNFVTHKQNNPNKTLTECAFDTGFYDQSQLIYLSQLITGSSPKAYFAKRNHINDYFLAH